MFKKSGSKAIIFITLSLLLSAAIVWGFISALNFLVAQIKIATEGSPTQTSAITRFNLPALREIGIIKD